MLTIDKLSILRREQLRDILKDFSLQLGPGDKAVLIGEEGNGKSTLLKLIHDPDSVEGYAEWSGSVSPGGRTGYLPQELGAAGAVGDGPDQGAELLGVPPGGVLGDPPQGGLVPALGQHTGQGLGLLGLGHRLQRLLVAEEPLDIQRIVG